MKIYLAGSLCFLSFINLAIVGTFEALSVFALFLILTTRWKEAKKMFLLVLLFPVFVILRATPKKHRRRW